MSRARGNGHDDLEELLSGVCLYAERPYKSSNQSIQAGLWKFAKLARSRSSPSPPASRRPPGRGDTSRKSGQNGRAVRRRLDSSSSNNTARSSAAPAAGNLDWSTSYQAGSSSSASRSSDEDSETEDELASAFRGRIHSQSGTGTSLADDMHATSSLLHRRARQRAGSSGDSASGSAFRARAFTRSRSPAVTRPPDDPKISAGRHLSPAVSRFSRRSAQRGPTTIFPALLAFRIPLFPTAWTWIFSADFRKCGESHILLGAILYASHAIYDLPASDSFIAHSNLWIVKELLIFSIVVVLYSLWTHSTVSHLRSRVSVSTNSASSSQPPSSASQPTRLATETRDSRRHSALVTAPKTDFGFIWMTVPKNYRESLDDGVFIGLLLGPLIAAALLISALRSSTAVPPRRTPLPREWRIEAPMELHDPGKAQSALEALVLARYNLVDLATFCSTILLLHVCTSWWAEARCRKRGDTAEGERASVPRSESLRSWYYILFTLGVSAATFAIKMLLQRRGYGIWQHLNYFEMIFSALFYQFTLYIAIRLAHRGFTLGELSLVCFGGTALSMEFLNITIARIWPVTTPFIKTHRLPTPLLIFQLSLIAGSFLTGFLLSPFLVLSRHIAQRPVRRLRNPQDKQRTRRQLALGFYVGTVVIVVGLIGMWTRWTLGNRDPWLWVIFWLLEGKRKWTRPALLAYWAALGCLSVAGWNRQLARSRRYWPRNSATGETLMVPGAVDTSASASAAASAGTEQAATGVSAATGLPTTLGVGGMTFAALPNLPNGAQVTTVATDLLDAADKHVPTLGLNARRKFFHALAVVMFIPGVAVDPAFTHLSFSAAFALFTFTEYVRYFAIYPFGATIHLFMNEFLDHRDRGTAIVSHFYLLTGCAGSVWLEGPTQLLQFTGILTLGVGDAMASIVGKRIGFHRWSPTTSKTLEGSIAFTVTIVASAWLLRLFGLAEPFSTLRYAAVVALSSTLEALSDQNDNLTLPLFMWSMLVVADV
ncbi:putative dolichol kinase [Lyophyllum shimeji]|uniref:dolichol kinase n=1 Tax=Lyophyllum shimeji TaxID=47721 RepID=A0A9P3PR79_LYOSH|nr:putative dolichol kinase [Lyophyllum shimeji]